MKAATLALGTLLLILATPIQAQTPDRILRPPAPLQQPFGATPDLHDWYAGQLIGGATPKLTLPTTTTCTTYGTTTYCETK